MPTRATTWPGYRWRILLIAAMCLGFAGWSFYDGTIGYPKANKVRQAYLNVADEYVDRWWFPQAKEKGWWLDVERIDALLSDYEKSAEEDPALRAQIAAKKGWPQDVDELVQNYKAARAQARDEYWPDLAAQNGWSTDPGSVPHRKSGTDILTQFIMFGITFPIGLVYGIAVLRSLNRWVELDEQGLSTSGGARVPFEAITRLNKRRWEKKGIAVVHYKDDGGADRKIDLDDWKFEREPMDEIVLAIESRLSPDKIQQPASTLAAAVEEAKGEPVDVETDQGDAHDGEVSSSQADKTDA